MGALLVWATTSRDCSCSREWKSGMYWERPAGSWALAPHGADWPPLLLPDHREKGREARLEFRFCFLFHWPDQVVKEEQLKLEPDQTVTARWRCGLRTDKEPCSKHPSPALRAWKNAMNKDIGKCGCPGFCSVLWNLFILLHLIFCFPLDIKLRCKSSYLIGHPLFSRFLFLIDQGFLHLLLFSQPFISSIFSCY